MEIITQPINKKPKSGKKGFLVLIFFIALVIFSAYYLTSKRINAPFATKGVELTREEKEKLLEQFSATASVELTKKEKEKILQENSTQNPAELSKKEKEDLLSQFQ